MAITNTWRWTGTLSTEWTDDNGQQSNWSLLDGTASQPGFPSGAGDIAVIDIDASITANSGVGSAEELQVVNGATITFASGNFGAGSDGSGGLIVDESATLVIASAAAVANTGSLDVVGLVEGGSLVVQAGAGFDDRALIVGVDPGANGEVTVDAASLLVAQSSPGAGDGVLTIGDDGVGSVDISGNSLFFAATTIVGKNADSNGTLTVDGSTWGGTNLTIGPSGTGTVTIDGGSTAALANILIGPNGEFDVTGAGGVTTAVIVPSLTLAFGTLNVSGGGEVNMGGAGVQGAVDVASTLVGLGTINGNVVVEQGGAVEADQPLDGTLTVNGDISGAGMVEPVRTFEVNGGIAAGITIQFGASSPGDGVLQLDVPRGDDGTISGFSAGNTIDVKGLVYSDAVFTPGTAGNPGVLTLSGGADAPLALKVDGNYAPDSFVATPDTTDTLVTLVPCYCRGTLILTEHGEVAVEALTVGDRVMTLSGAPRPIVWIGFGRDIVTRKNPLARPVIVRRGALADNTPRRDLYLTHGHSLHLDGVLIPVEHLVNHRSILWDDTARVVEYYHIELDSHDVVLAEGAPAESYYDAGNRGLFQNARPGLEAGAARPIFAPVLTGGDTVETAWARLFARAGGRIDRATTDDPDLHLLVNGERLDPASRPEGVYTFALAGPPATALLLRSRSGVPSLLGVNRREHRRLGVAIRQIILTRPGIITCFDHDSPLFAEGGCHPPERGHRWTDGELSLPAPLFAHLRGAFTLIVHTQTQAMKYSISAAATQAA